MAELNPGVRPATEDDHEAAAEALALAFADDPAWAHLLPDDATRAERLLVFFTAEIGNLIPEHRELWVTEDGSAAAIWAHPGRWRGFQALVPPLPGGRTPPPGARPRRKPAQAGARPVRPRGNPLLPGVEHRAQPGPL